MHDNLESLLLDIHGELYSSIKGKAVDVLGLSMDVYESVIAFGKVLDFHLFWISDKNRKQYFNARIYFAKSKYNNIVKLELNESNRTAIFDAIDNIYINYMTALRDGGYQNELQRQENAKDIRDAKAKNRWNETDVELIWKGVTDRVLYRHAGSISDANPLDADTMSRFAACGAELVSTFDDIICIMKNSHYLLSVMRRASVYSDHIDNDNVTLAEIAPKYKVSRERIRQIINLADRKLFGYFKGMMLFDNVEFNERVKKLAALFSEFDYDADLLIKYGLKDIGKRKKYAIFNVLFGQAFAQNIIDTCIVSEK